MPGTLNVLVLAAGEGTRLKGSVPKVLTSLWGRPAVAWPVTAALSLQPERLVVVGSDPPDAVQQALEGLPVQIAVQTNPKGTGHAVLSAQDALAGAEGPLVILYGDGPLVTPDLLAQLLAAHRAHPGPLTVLTAEVDDPTGYGRILRAPDGSVAAIVEEADATPEQKAIREINVGLWVLELPRALEDLTRVGTDNAQGEVYLTDLVAVTVADGQPVGALRWDRPQDVLGFNDQRELAHVRGILRDRILDAHLAAGVEIMDPATTFIDAEVTIEAGARILPCTMIEGQVSIASGCQVGPFTHLRDGTVLEAGAKVGNFTETKKSVLGAGAKAGHLTYLGDARIGAGANIGAGTITANYDGKHKHPTVVGERAFIGSGTVLVAPANVGRGAMTGAGAIVTRNTEIGDEEVWVGLPARLLRKPVAPGSGEADR